jgi:hypothetical protein
MGQEGIGAGTYEYEIKSTHLGVIGHLETRRIAGKEHRGQEAACLVIPRNSRDRKMHVLEHVGNSLDRGVGLETPRNSLDKNRCA